MLHQERRFLRKNLGYSVYKQLTREYKCLLFEYDRLKQLEKHLENLISEYEIDVLAEYKNRECVIVENGDIALKICAIGCSQNMMKTICTDTLRKDVYLVFRWVKQHRDYIKLTLYNVASESDGIRNILIELDLIVSGSLFIIEKLSSDVFTLDSKLKEMKIGNLDELKNEA